MAERDRTHSFGRRCQTHERWLQEKCACGSYHGVTDVECGSWCPDHEGEYQPTPDDVAWADRMTRRIEEMW